MDQLANMLNKIKNAGKAKKELVAVPYSKLLFAVASVLHKEGYIASVDKRGRKEKKFIDIGIAYEGDAPKIEGLARVSKISRRVYSGVRGIRPVRQKFGDLILSTPKGILTGNEAKRERVGGEVLFKIW